MLRILDGGLAVQAGPSEGVRRRTTIRQDQLMEMLASKEPALPAALSSFLERLEGPGAFLGAAPKSLQLRWRGPEDMVFALSAIDQDANFQSYNVNWVADGVGQIDLAHQYLGQLAALLGGQVRRTAKPHQWHVVMGGTTLPKAMDLLSRQGEWAATIEACTDELTRALESAG